VQGTKKCDAIVSQSKSTLKGWATEGRKEPLTHVTVPVAPSRLHLTSSRKFQRQVRGSIIGHL
jgi:hypothetical protein